MPDLSTPELTQAITFKPQRVPELIARLHKAIRSLDDGPLEDHVFDFYSCDRLVISVESLPPSLSSLIEIVAIPMRGRPEYRPSFVDRAELLWHSLTNYRTHILHSRCADGVIELRYKSPDDLKLIAAPRGE